MPSKEQNPQAIFSPKATKFDLTGTSMCLPSCSDQRSILPRFLANAFERSPCHQMLQVVV
jgi:hypothetical protein